MGGSGGHGSGGWFARVWRRLRGPVDAQGKRLRKPFVRRGRGYASLQFTRNQTQSRMRMDDPDLLLIDYTRTMLAALLWAPPAPRVGMIGLGGGSQVKFIHRHLPAVRLEVVENNPWVIDLRGAFGVPEDDARLQVILDDGAGFIAARPGRYDVLLVDGYDETGIPPMLASEAFYTACREALAPRGALSVNLFCADAETHLARLRRVFGAQRVLLLDEARMKNRVAFAWRGSRPMRGTARRLSAAMAASASAQLGPVLERVERAIPPPR
ncbi:hypothetical protein [Luteimonas abyssi]|uniref:spermine/spermidine synthase domain-containing protein n=1 Tax=Luteimonas abyssi TaxID=1247514 RepID=UPI000737C614|nr:hypothetical protein [Luteimonas abyssi]